MTTWQIIWVMAAACLAACLIGAWLSIDFTGQWRAGFLASAIMMVVWLVVVGALAVWEQ